MYLWFSSFNYLQILHEKGAYARINFWKFKVALNPMYRIFLNFAKSCVLSYVSKVDNIKKISSCRFWIISP